MFDTGAETMDLPFHEKMKFEQGDDGFSFGSVLPGSHLQPANLEWPADKAQRTDTRPLAPP